MILMVLNAPMPFFHPQYRGTMRFPPCHWDSLPDDSEPNRLFFWFLNVSDQAGMVSDPSVVYNLRHLVEVFTCNDAAHPYEIVELVGESGAAELGTEFLGFDLSSGGGYSLLDGWGSAEFDSPGTTPAGILAQLIRRHYTPLLNDHWLFPDAAIARECLTTIQAVQTLVPGTYEYGEFKPVAIYRLPGQPPTPRATP